MRNSLLPEEVRYKLRRWEDGKKIDWFFNNRLSPWLLKGVDLQMKGKQFYVALYLMLLTVDILSGFYQGKRANLGTFSAFMSRYFGDVLTRRATNPLYRRGIAPKGLNARRRITFVEILWVSLRYGLAERCMVYPHVSLTERSRYYCKCYKRVGLRLDIHTFYKDFVRACREYGDNVYGDYFVRQRFIKRFDQLC
jgi:hypothetical protein